MWNFTTTSRPVAICMSVLANNYCFPHYQVNTVFDHLRVTAHFNGYVFFLEEDHYVSPDFVVVAKQLIALKEAQCHDCDFVNLGTYQKTSYSATSSQVSTALDCNQVRYHIVTVIRT